MNEEINFDDKEKEYAELFPQGEANFPHAESEKPDNELTGRILNIGGVFALITIGVFLLTYLQIGAWQILAHVIGLGIGILILGFAILSHRRGNNDLAGTLGLFAAMIAYSDAELFWANATIYNLIGGTALIVVVGLAILPHKTNRWLLFAGINIGFILLFNEVEPVPRFNINVSPVLRLITPLVTVGLVGLIVLQMGRVFRRGNIRTRLVIAFLLITLIPLALQAFVNNRSFQSALVENANLTLAAIGSEASGKFDTYITSSLNVLNSESQFPAFVDFLSLDPTLREDKDNPMRRAASTTLNVLGRKDATRIQSYALLDNNGINVLDTISFNIGKDESNTEYFQKAFSENTDYVSSVEFSQIPGIFHAIYFSSPIRDSRNNAIGVIRFKINASVLQEILRETNGLAGEDSFGVLFDSIEGNLIHLAHGTAPETLYTAIMPYKDPEQLEALQTAERLPLTTAFGAISMTLPELQENLEQVDAQPIFSAEDVATGDRLNQVAVTRLAEKPEWILAFFQPQDVFLSAAQEQATTSIYLVIGIAALIGFIAIPIARGFSDPITELSEVAAKVGAGDLSLRAKVNSDDEYGVLAGAFNNMTTQLENLIGSLEFTVAERTEDLERRAKYLQAAAEIGQTATGLHDLDELLDSVTHLISDRFDFYHVGILLLDDLGNYAELRAANSEGGWRMIARGHKLRVGEEGIVGYVTKTGKPRIEQSLTGEAGRHFANPELPHTLSEMALPLISSGKILGALDVQSQEEEAFSQEDAEVLQVLADQVAMAINNTILFEQVEASLEGERRAYGELSREAWEALLHQHSDLAFTSTKQGITSSEKDWEAVSIRAIDRKKPIVSDGVNKEDYYLLAIPVTVRGKDVVGVIETKKHKSEGQWTNQEITMLEAISEQLGVSLENARLFEETQRLAQRERLVADVAGRVWSSSNVDTILQTTVQELGKALNASQGTIRLNIHTPNEDNNQPDDAEPQETGVENR